MKTTSKVSGIAAAAAALLVGGSVPTGHRVDASTSVRLADPTCSTHKSCPKKEGKKESDKRDADKHEFSAAL